MTSEEDTQIFLSFCKQQWNNRATPNEFLEAFKETFETKQIKRIFEYFFTLVGIEQKQFSKTLSNYIMEIIKENPATIFYDIDLNDEVQVSGARNVIQLTNPDFYTHLRVNDEVSAKSALNILLVVLKDNDRERLKKLILKLSSSPYLSILIASGQLLCPEKYREAQILFKEIDPFECPIFQLPLSQAHLPFSLFPPELNDLFHYVHNCQDLVFMLSIIHHFKLKHDPEFVFETDLINATLFVYVIHLYLSKPSYTLSMFIRNLIETRYSANKDASYDEKLEELLHYFYDGPNLINKHTFTDNNTNTLLQEELPNGVFPTFDKAFHFLHDKPENISIETLIEDSLRYPAFAQDVVSIFVSKLQEKDIKSSIIIAKQIFKHIEDIKTAWYIQNEIIHVLQSLYECIYDLRNEEEFEILFLLFITFIFDEVKNGDKFVDEIIIQFLNTLNDPFNLYLKNVFFDGNLVVCSDDQIETLDESKPIDRVVLFLIECNRTNDLNVDTLLQTPYLFVSAFIWGIQTVHPNSLKLYNVKFPNYQIFTLWFTYLSICHQRADPSLTSTLNHMYFSVRSSNQIYSMLIRFLPLDVSEVRYIIMDQLSQLTAGGVTLKAMQSLFTVWRAMIKLLTLEKLIILLLDILLINDENATSKIFHSYFHYAGIAVASACLTIPNEISASAEQINEYSDKSDDALRRALWTTLIYIENYEGGNSEAFGVSVFCVLLLISMDNCLESEFQKVIDFTINLRSKSRLKSLHWSFCSSILILSMYIPKLQNHIRIDMFGIDYLQLNWQIGIDYYSIQAEREKKSALHKSNQKH